MTVLENRSSVNLKAIVVLSDNFRYKNMLRVVTGVIVTDRACIGGQNGLLAKSIQFSIGNILSSDEVQWRHECGTISPEINRFSFFQGYKIIFSNSDAWRMDCGFGSWIEGNEKCSDYAGANPNLKKFKLHTNIN